MRTGHCIASSCAGRCIVNSSIQLVIPPSLAFPCKQSCSGRGNCRDNCRHTLQSADWCPSASQANQDSLSCASRARHHGGERARAAQGWLDEEEAHPPATPFSPRSHRIPGQGVKPLGRRRTVRTADDGGAGGHAIFLGTQSSALPGRRSLDRLSCRRRRDSRRQLIY